MTPVMCFFPSNMTTATATYSMAIFMMGFTLFVSCYSSFTIAATTTFVFARTSRTRSTRTTRTRSTMTTRTRSMRTTGNRNRFKT